MTIYFFMKFAQFEGWTLWYIMKVSSQGVVYLRLRSLFVKTDWVCHVWCNFYPGYTCRTIVIFGTLKDDSLLINNLESNNCFSHGNVFQNVVNTLSKMVNHFLSKSSVFVQFGPYDFVQISPAYGPNAYQIINGENLDFQYQHQQW